MLRVVCNSALGHHRSVAFLSPNLQQGLGLRIGKSRSYIADLEKKRAGGARTRQKAGWKDKRRKKNAFDGEDEVERKESVVWRID